MQLQETQLQDKLKVREALELYASFYPDPADWRELLDRWGLAGKNGTSFGKLSGGQKQRLFIALALVGNPEVVFLDELTAGLDPGARHATWDLISQVRASGVTVVLVSHFMDEVEELCDRVAILERGRIAALDTPAGLVDSAGGEYRMRFRPTGSLDEPSLAGLPGVVSVIRRGARVDVTGTGDFASRRHRGAGPQAGPRRGPADRGTQPGQRLRRADRPDHGHVRESKMNGFSRLAVVETRLFLREKAALIGGVRAAGGAGHRVRPDPGVQRSAEGAVGSDRHRIHRRRSVSRSCWPPWA